MYAFGLWKEAGLLGENLYGQTERTYNLHTEGLELLGLFAFSIVILLVT